MNRREWIYKTGLAGTALTLGASEIFAKPVPKITEARKVYIFSKHLQWLDYKEMAKFVKEAGFDGVDLTVRPGGHVLPENVERDLPLAVEAFKNADLEIETITTAIEDYHQKYTELILKTSSHHGA